MGLVVGLFAAVPVVTLVGKAPFALKIVLTLVSVPPAGYFIWYWLRRRRTRAYGMPVLDVPTSVQSAWETLDFIANLLSLIRIPLSRHVVIATFGAAVWSSLTLVGYVFRGSGRVSRLFGVGRVVMERGAAGRAWRVEGGERIVA